MHPHVPQKWLTQAEREANTIENLNVLIRQLEGRLKVADHRIADLELIVGVGKRVLLEERDRLRADLRDMNKRMNEALGLPY